MKVLFANNREKLLPYPYLTALLVGIVILSFAAILTRISEFDIGPGATIFNRYGIATLGISFWQIIKSSIRNGSDEKMPFWKIRYEPYDIMLLLAEAIFSLGCVFLWAISLTQTSVANSNLLHNMTPIFSASLSFLFLGQSFDRRFLIGIIIAVGASIGIQLGDLYVSHESFVGDCLALLSALLYSLAFLVREKLCHKFTIDVILLWSCTCRSILILPIVLFFEGQVFPISLSGWLAVILLGICVQIFGHGLLIYSLKAFNSSFSTLCLLLDPVLTALAAWLILAEQLSFWNCIAFAGVLTGIYLSGTSKSVKAMESTE